MQWWPQTGSRLHFLPFLMPVPEGNRCPGDEVGLRWSGKRGLGHYLECLFCLKMADKEQRQMIKCLKIKLLHTGGIPHATNLKKENTRSNTRPPCN